MKLLKLLKHDMTEGIARRYAYLILPVIVSLFSCVSLHFRMAAYRQYNENIGSATIMDYWIYLVQGAKQYKFNVFEAFQIPAAWVGLYIFLLIALNNYPLNDLEKWGHQVIISSQSRFHWWISKILWIVCFAAVYLAVCMLTVSVYALLDGASPSLGASPRLMSYVSKRGFASCSMKYRIFINIVLPYLFMVLLGILQFLMSIRIPSIHAFIVLFVVLVVSTYKKAWLLIGNWAMPYRLYPVSSTGLHSKVCGLLCMGFIVLGIVVGYLIFRKKDIFEKLV